MKYLTLTVVISMGLFINGCSSKSNRYTLSHWIEDQNGCKTWNPNPAPNETITWTGKCVNGYIDGYGTLQWYQNGVAGMKNIGTFKKGKQDGKGKMITSNQTYSGEYKNGLFDGQGILIFKSGEKYIGEFKRAKRDGKGTSSWSSGNKYIGEYKEDKKHGKGILTWTKRESCSFVMADMDNPSPRFKYEDCYKSFHGIFEQDVMKSGKLEFYQTHKVYNGPYGSKGQMLGKPKGSQFVKDQNGCLHKRPYDADFKVSWTGQCKNGYADGYGKEIWTYAKKNKQQIVYEGVLRKGLKHGKGKELSNTSRHSGSIFGGNVNACDVYIGEWRNNKFHGKGKYESHHGESCSDNLAYSYNGNSHSLKGTWNNGYKDGEFIQQYFGSNTLYKYIYNQGKFVSSHRMNGSIVSDIGHAIVEVAKSSSNLSESNSLEYEVGSKSKFYKKMTTDGKYRKIKIRCENGFSDYVEESYDNYSSSTKHYFQANAGAVWQPNKYDNLDESARELCQKHR